MTPYQHMFPDMKKILLWLLVVMTIPTILSGKVVKEDSLRQAMVLKAQTLRNMSPSGDIVNRLRAITDSLGADGHDDYYFASRNVLIDQLFGDNRFAEADAEAIKMEEEALRAANPTARAMSHRVRGQMFFKLSQPYRAMAELDTALSLTPDFRVSLNTFSTGASINEWRAIVGAQLSDTASVSDARRRYIRAVEYWCGKGWEEPSRHFAVTALAFKAEEATDPRQAAEILDNAAGMIDPALPARAYEHYYKAKSLFDARNGDFDGAIAAVDTLLATHADFPWFYLDDLKLRASILHQAGRHDESAADYERHAALRDSLATEQVSNQLADLTALYHTELQQEHQRASTYRLIALGGIAILLLILLIVSLMAMINQRKRNRLLVERLRELDRQSQVSSQSISEPRQENDIEKLDRHMITHRPYIDPSFGRQELARATGLGAETISRIIREARGTTVLGYINGHRLDEARRVLESDSTETLTEIATRLGFGTLRTFQRTFSERFSMPPSRYRSLAREK